MATNDKKRQIPITLSRTLGVWEVTLLGVGALLGGGIFTLLGHAAGLAGGGLIFAMMLGAAISFLNLNSYVSLATTFPEAGGGYLWVKEGLGDLQGFMSGWISWMAHSVACSLYAVSFGIFAAEFAFSLLGVPMFGISLFTWRLLFTTAVVVFFGLVNYRGVALTGKAGGYISLTLIAILLFYIFFGVKRMTGLPDLLNINFLPLLPFGLVGVLQAASLFYIAFEGSEIQAQTGEEAKDPARTLKISLFSSWAIISVLYLLIAFVIVGATSNLGEPSWKVLMGHSDRAIIESAKQFMPVGYILMVLGGLLANIAALNATIYSSSRVLFAMARDKFVWPKLADMHELNLTPYRAVLLSVAAIIFVAVFLPLKDIAGAADILFILLFSQLNLAYIELRRKKPEARWYYVVPFGPVLPLTAVVLYFVLGVSLFHVSPIAIYFTAIWFLLGLVNYFAFTKTQEREDLEREVMYEHTTRFREKLGYRIILPVANEEHWNMFSQIALAVAREEQGELLVLRIHEVPPTLPLAAGFNTDHERRVLDKIEKSSIEKKTNIDTRLLAARSVPETILETVAVENGDLLIMGWDGYVDTKGFIFGRKVDTVLHRAKSDLLVVKLQDPEHIKRILVPVPLDENPNLRFAGKVATALANWFDGEVTVVMIIPDYTSNISYARYHVLLEDRIRELKFKTTKEIKLKLIRSNHIASAIIKEANHHDVVLLPAARGRITKVIGMGSIPEQIAKHCRKTIIMAKGHRGIIQPFFDYVKSRF
ncbi:MAG: amino acid permease [Candidatus Sungiibacteriota bacterium]|uniref:Amino acid permease n=1 Tax=Candidatus Sungiibacteriota bacterium TaxID=2750080 RepID=A0A7T5RJA7_9BACT|nr:MAG: amino acid permease [Candidatus Sungbacteria bacterium]